MFDIVATFLSGGIIPLDFPKFFAKFFRIYTFSLPYLLSGTNFSRKCPRHTLAASSTYLDSHRLMINKLVWNKGIRMYTAAGM